MTHYDSSRQPRRPFISNLVCVTTDSKKHHCVSLRGKSPSACQASLTILEQGAAPSFAFDHGDDASCFCFPVGKHTPADLERANALVNVLLREPSTTVTHAQAWTALGLFLLGHSAAEAVDRLRLRENTRWQTVLGLRAICAGLTLARQLQFRANGGGAGHAYFELLRWADNADAQNESPFLADIVPLVHGVAVGSRAGTDQFDTDAARLAALSARLRDGAGAGAHRAWWADFHYRVSAFLYEMEKGKSVIDESVSKVMLEHY